MTKVSICITYYNQENYVRDSIESVLNLDLPCELEILIGDDGSIDGTIQEIKKYQEKFPDKISLIQNKKNNEQNVIKRASLNRLNLASNAKGDYILFLDGDDFYCDKTFIKEALEILEHDTSISACAFNFKYINQTDEKIFEQNMKDGLNSSKDYIANEYYTPSGAFVFRNTLSAYKMRKLKEINNFDDNGITVFFIQYGDFYFINKPVYAYRQHENSSWNSISKIEQILLNALDYKLLSKAAPKLDKYILKREFSALKYIYKNRKNLPELLGNHYDKYVEFSSNDKFIHRLLIWKNLNPLKKLKIKYKFQTYKLKVKFY